MIKLSPQFTTTVEYLYGGTMVGSVTTDTLYVTSVRLDFSSGAIYAEIVRGTTDPSTGIFEQNYDSVSITVNPDGSFLSSDGKWQGNLGTQATSLVAQLASTFDEFILGAGLVTGTSVSDSIAYGTAQGVVVSPPLG